MKYIDSTNLKADTLMIEIASLTYRYPKSQIDTLRIPKWQVAVGEHVFLQGASGSGKSTLLQLLCGLRVGTGNLHIAGTNIGKLTQAKRDRFRARHIGMVFQQFNLIPYLSALDNVVLATSLAGISNNAKARADELLDQVGLHKLAKAQTAHSLSIGQQQRVAIARALINAPDILLLDEPTSALDDINQAQFIEVLFKHLARHPKTTLIFVSHDTRLTAYFPHSTSLSQISAHDHSVVHKNAY